MRNAVLKGSQVSLGQPFVVEVRPEDFDLPAFGADAPADGEDGLMALDGAASDPEAIIGFACERAKAIVEEGTAEAGRIKSEGEALIEARRRELEAEAARKAEAEYEAARGRGYDEGYAQCLAEYEGLLRETASVKEGAVERALEYLAGIEKDVVSLIIEIARKVVGDQVGEGGDYLLHMVREAFARCTNKESLILNVSQDDYAYAVGNRDRILAMMEGTGRLEIEAAPNLSKGSCVVTTPIGEVDSGAETRLRKIEAALMADFMGGTAT
ncbi:MAG: FliH/SctL family protein [Oscillospiraceae bacterium]|nr:FliH/SctL family protein [Oscillospiraceae bacterium]